MEATSERRKEKSQEEGLQSFRRYEGGCGQSLPPLKVVFDTNVYISEALFDALAEVIVGAGREQVFSVYVSDFILTEIRDVLINRFHTTRRFASLTQRRVRRFATLVSTSQRSFKEVADTKDHPVLETAINAGADYLVTGDKHLLAVSPYQGIRILGVNSFRSLLLETGSLSKRQPN